MACVQASCTVKEQLSQSLLQRLYTIVNHILATANLTAIACNAPIRNKTSQYAAIAITFYVLSTAALLIRFLTIFGMEQQFGYDDWCIILVFVRIHFGHLFDRVLQLIAI